MPDAREGHGDAEKTAGAICANLSGLPARLEAWKVAAAVLRELATRILKEAVSGEYTDYAGSEQASMVLQTIRLQLPVRGPHRRFDLCFARRAGARGPARRGRKSGPLRPESGQAELQTAAGQARWEIDGSACYVPARSTPDGVASRSSRTTCRLRRRTGFSNRRRYADQRSQR